QTVLVDQIVVTTATLAGVSRYESVLAHHYPARLSQLVCGAPATAARPCASGTLIIDPPGRETPLVGSLPGQLLSCVGKPYLIGSQSTEISLASTFASFSSLYFSTLLMLLGSGLLSTYLGLRLSAANVSEIWIGVLMTAYYIGLVMGASVGHRLIAQVGHIRAFVACAGVVTASVLGHALTSSVEIWLVLRWLVGVAMMCQYMVLESWLNEQAESHQRGRVFAGYMLVTFLGLGLGQLVLTIMPELSVRHIILVAMCSSLCLVPVAVTRRLHPAPLHPAPLEIRLFVKRIPQALATIGVAGLLLGSFYGLAPAYA